MSQIQIRDRNNRALPLINIRLSLGQDGPEDSIFDYETDNAGNKGWPVPFWPTRDYTLHINKRNIDIRYQSLEVYVPTPSSGNYDDVQIILNRTSLEKLQINSKRLYTVSGRSTFIKGETGFLDYFRFLRGEDIRPLLEQSESLGSNCRRNFLMTMNTGVAAGIGPCNPEDFGNAFYDKFSEFMSLYNEYGLYGYFSIFPDNGLFPAWAGNTSKQITHWNKLGDIAKNIDNVFAFELTNEPNAHTFNQVNRSAFSKINNLLCCSMSYGTEYGGNRYPPPYWDFGDLHPPRGYPHSVKDCNQSDNPNYSAGEATLVGEPLGFGSIPNRESDPNIAREIAGSAIGTSIGIIYHSQHGGFSQLYDFVEHNCALAWFDILNGN
jgi:hypothetical protein